MRLQAVALTILAAAATILAPCRAPCAHVVVDVGGGGDYVNIQEGLNAVEEGDSVVVAPGVYSGLLNRDLNFHGKDITLISREGAEETVIECSRQGRGLTFESGETLAALVQGFTIRNGKAAAGGGISCSGGSSPRIVGCVVLGCEADNGGGMNWEGTSSGSIEDCVFDSNVTDGGGGGVRCDGASAPTITGCTFIYNQAELGGGMMARDNSSPHLNNVLFEANTARYGGGMRCEGGSATVTHATFRSNHATYSGGGMGTNLGATAQITDCLFIGNRADTRGGGFTSASAAEMTRCTFAGNRAVNGGGLFCGADGQAVITNTIIAMSTMGAGVYCDVPAGTYPQISHSCVYGNAGGDALCGGSHDNLFSNPLFCHYATWDLQLDAESPCLPANNIWGEQIGLYGQGCGGSVAVEHTSWGYIKAMYR